jgi:hypothetical protein
MTQDITAIECWSYGEQYLFDLKACPIGRDELKDWALEKIPAREGIPPSAGLKLFHC